MTKSLRSKIKEAGSIGDLRRLEEIVTSAYERGGISSSDLGKLDVYIMERIASLETSEPRFTRPIDGEPTRHEIESEFNGTLDAFNEALGLDSPFQSKEEKEAFQRIEDRMADDDLQESIGHNSQLKPNYILR